MKSTPLLLIALVALTAACDDGSPTGRGPERGGNDSGNGRPGVDADDDEDASQEDAEPGDEDAAGGGDGAAAECTAGEAYCVDDSTRAVCSEDASGFEEVSCSEGTLCVSTSGTCEEVLCVPYRSACITETTFHDCLPDGQGYGPAQDCAEGEFCDEGNCRPVGCRPNVMFAIDGSSSMSGEFGAIRNSIAAVAAANPDVAMGLSMFPTGLGCSIGDGTGGLFGAPGVTWPHVPISVDGADQIDSWFGSNDAAGGATPMISTIEWMAENAETIWGPVRENGYLIVMSEGADTCRCDRPDGSRPGQEQDYIDCLVEGAESATQALLAQGIRTYVIGYQFTEEDVALNAIAENGGTSITEYIYAGSEASLTDAFEAVLSDAKLCN